MTHLVVLIHADPSVAPKYVDALKAASVKPFEFVVLNSKHGGFSSAYRRTHQELKDRAKFSSSSTPVLRELIRSSGAAYEVDRYDTITLASFSAGYALVQGLLADPDEARGISGVVGIDSWHSGFDPDGTARDSQLSGLVRHALRTRENGCVCWIGHSDVRTPQKPYKLASGKMGTPFASTSQVAEELRRLAGLPADGNDVREGGLRVKAYNVRKLDHDEHVAALTEWGPWFLANAVAQVTERVVRFDTDVPGSAEPPTESLGRRALAIALAEQIADVKEIRGSKHHPRIIEYLAGSERGGRNIGGALRADEIPWCAAGASWCMFTAAVRGEILPHKYRCSVRELWEDAIASGAARGASRIRRGYRPNVGDLAIMTRGGPAAGEGAAAFARTAGKGHVGRVMAWSLDGSFSTMDGNVGDKWTQVERHASDSSFVGVIAYPDVTGPKMSSVTDDEVDVLRILDATALWSRYIAGAGDVTLADVGRAMRASYREVAKL